VAVEMEAAAYRAAGFCRPRLAVEAWDAPEPVEVFLDLLNRRESAP